ncbi:MAG: S8 family serine peptidase [Bacteroidales bacterium]|nr:S8 family serine peptidase [Bacteroidales bacterium]
MKSPTNHIPKRYRQFGTCNRIWIYKILLTLSKDADKNRLLNVIQSDLSVEISGNRKNEKNVGAFIVLSLKDERNILSSTIDKYRNSPDILSALPMLEASDGKLQGITNEFIVKLANGTTFEQLEDLVKKNNCIIIKENEFVKNQYLISVSKTSVLNSLQIANLFYETRLFEFSAPNFFREKILHSNDPLFGNQWPLKNTGQSGGISGADIKIEQAWTITQGRSEIRIAVVDEGVDLTHPDLFRNLETGFDATGNGTQGAPLSGEFHGTACAGIIAAEKGNGIGIEGVAPNCKILPVHASFGYYATDQWLADALEWSWHPSFGNADVISNSWGGGGEHDAITNAINSAVNQGRGGLGCVVLFSSGNDYNSTVSYPARLSNVIAVGATSVNDSRESYSNYGSALDVVAPGGNKNIYTTDIVGFAGYSTSDYASDFDGTSAACPHAAGVAALILSVNRCLTGTEVKQILELSCDKVGGYCYNPGKANGLWNNQMGYVPTSPSNVRFNFTVLSSLENDLYLQNQTISSGAETYNAMNKIEIGYNVTSNISQGNFVVTRDANVTLHAGDVIVLKPGTTITPGPNGSFRAYVDPFFTCTQYPMGIMANRDNSLYTGIKDYEVELIEKSQALITESLITEDLMLVETFFKIYPNPSNGDISIEYSLNESDIVEISLYDNSGRPVYKLKNKSLHEAGTYQVRLTGVDLPSGIYYCVLQTNDTFKTEKNVIIK